MSGIYVQKVTDASIWRFSDAHSRASNSVPTRFFLIMLIIFVASCVSAIGQDEEDGRGYLQEPDHTQKVQVFILSGQSNMVGKGTVSPAEKPGTLLNLLHSGHYSHLVDSDGQWKVRKDVRAVYRRFLGDNTEWWANNLTVGWADDPEYFGPELQFGYVLGDAFGDTPVLILKVGTGNRALGWDFRPPGTTRYEHRDVSGTTLSFPGYRQCPEASLGGSQQATKGNKDQCGSCNFDPNSKKVQYCPVWWPTQSDCSSCWYGWYAGKQFDEDLYNAKAILDNLGKYYPGYREQGFEIAGFVFWQGYRDTLTEGHAVKYKENLIQYIKKIWKRYSSYDGAKKFVVASVGFGGCTPEREAPDDGYKPLEEFVFNAQRSVSGEDFPKFQDRVKTVDARPFWRHHSISPIEDRPHYNRNAETYMEVGNALGLAMVDLLFNRTDFVQTTCPDAEKLSQDS